jgi:hypothetical protein
MNLTVLERPPSLIFHQESEGGVIGLECASSFIKNDLFVSLANLQDSDDNFGELPFYIG